MALVLVALTMVTTHLVADEVFTDPARFTNDGYNFVMVETKMIMNATITQNFKLMQEAITYGFKLAGNFAHEGDVLMIRIYLSDNTTIAAVVDNANWDQAFSFLEKNPDAVLNFENASRAKAERRSWNNVAKMHLKIYKEMTL